MRKLLFLLPVLLLLFGCSNENQDPFAAYRSTPAGTLFVSGEKALADKHYHDAVKYLEALNAIYPFGPYAQQAQLDIIYAYHMDDDDVSAIAAADRYTHLYPRGQNVDYAYYMKGLIGFSEGLSWMQRQAGISPAQRDISTMEQSFVSFGTLAHYFPDSPYTPNAELRMRYIRNMMAQRELIIGDFYLQHDAYVAAANRASFVVQHYDGSPAVVDALAMMVKSYRALGLTKLANQSYKILAQNYPNSKQFAALNK